MTVMRKCLFHGILACILGILLFILQVPISLEAPSKIRSDELEILTYHVQTLVISRYAVTTISCKISNPTAASKEALFSVLLPSNAFISNLTIEAGGQNYSSLVKERQEARLTYEKAKIQGTNAAIIHQKERETSRFRIDVSVAAKSEVVFYLSYEELLERTLGNYTLRINVHPNYPVRDVLVDVTVHETRAISLLQVVKVPGGEDFFGAVSEWREGIKTARLQFDPNPEALPEKIPLYGQLVIQYDVERSLDAGDIQIEDGYFVHFFAPVELQHTPKHITFLIDTSTSMEGTKLDQVKEALKRILLDLNRGDAFSIVEFDTSAKRLTTSKYTTVSVRRATKFINILKADGSTNIDEGLKVALTSRRSPSRVLTPKCPKQSHRTEKKGPIWPPDAEPHPPKETESVMSHIIVLLTDGKATEGVKKHYDILKGVREKNKIGATIFCLGFGEDADMELLEKLAIQNGGYARKIYEDYDAADQLKNFYESLATPLLLDVHFSYSKDAVLLDSLTSNRFYNYFSGTELVVSGQLMNQNITGIRANITGQGRNGQFTMGVNDWNTVLPPDHHLLAHLKLEAVAKTFMSRLWGFLMLKDLLKQEKAAMKKRIKDDARRKALHLALQFHFVTPLTSLIVIQPNSQKCKDYYDDDYEDDYDDDYYYDDEDESETSKTDDKTSSKTKIKKKMDVGFSDVSITEGNYTAPEIPEDQSEVTDLLEDSDEFKSSDDTDEDILNSVSMKSYDLSPKVYSPYDREKHPDDQLLEEIQRQTYSAFSASSRLTSSGIISSGLFGSLICWIFSRCLSTHLLLFNSVVSTFIENSTVWLNL